MLEYLKVSFTQVQTLTAGSRSSISKARRFWTVASTTGPSPETGWGLEPKPISQALTPKSPGLKWMR